MNKDKNTYAGKWALRAEKSQVTYFWDILTINKDAAILHVIKPEKKPDDGAFARPRLPNLGKDLKSEVACLLLFLIARN